MYYVYNSIGRWNILVMVIAISFILPESFTYIWYGNIYFANTLFIWVSPSYDVVTAALNIIALFGRKKNYLKIYIISYPILWVFFATNVTIYMLTRQMRGAEEGEKPNGKYSQLTTTIACHGSLEKCSKKGPKKLKS